MTVRASLADLFVVLLFVIEEQFQALFAYLRLVMTTSTVTFLDFDGRGSFLLLILDLISLTSGLAFTDAPNDRHASLRIITRLLNFSGKRGIELIPLTCKLPVSDLIDIRDRNEQRFQGGNKKQPGTG
jgi:hypothetical protein